LTVRDMLLQKSGRKNLLAEVWFLLTKSSEIDQNTINSSTNTERAALNKWFVAHGELGMNAEQIVRSFILEAQAGTLKAYDSEISSVFGPKPATENFTNLRSPGASEAKIEADPGRSGRNVSRSDDAFVGQNTSDRKHKPGYPQSYGEPSFGHESDELTISGQDYQSQREIAGTGQDVQGTRTTTKPTRYTGLGQEGGQQPDHPPRGSGSSGNYGRGAYLESVKNAQSQELAKSQSRVLSPERLQAFRYGKPIPIVDISPENRKTVLTKGINDVFIKKARRDDEQGSFGVGGPTTFSEDTEEAYTPSLTKIEEDDEKEAEAKRLDEEAKRLQEQGFMEEAVDRRAKAMKIRGTISKSHYITTAKAHLQHGREFT